MNAKKCDMCEAYYDEYNTRNSVSKPNGFMFLNIDSNTRYFTHKATDCCPTCMDKIRNYIASLCVSEKNNEGGE